MGKVEIKISTLKYLAVKYAEDDITELEIRKKDITPEFFNDLERTIKRGELIKIQITSKVVGGKSTAGWVITEHINEQLLKKEMQLHYYCPEQYAFGRKTLDNDPDTNKPYENVCMLVDEMDEMQGTGYNSTIEEKYLDQFNQVMAQRFIHTVACSAKRTFDPNTELILSVEEKDITEKETKLSVYYHLISPSRDITQLIGIITIPVEKIMNKEIYQRYRTKKFRKFTLVQKYAVFQMRKLHFAEVILQVYLALEPLTTIIKPPKDLIEGKAHRILEQKRIPITMFAMEYIKTEVNSLITQKVAIETLERTRKKIKNKEAIKTLGTQKEKMIEELKKDIGQLNQYIEINKKYEEI